MAAVGSTSALSDQAAMALKSFEMANDIKVDSCTRTHARTHASKHARMGTHACEFSLISFCRHSNVVCYCSSPRLRAKQSEDDLYRYDAALHVAQVDARPWEQEYAFFLRPEVPAPLRPHDDCPAPVD